MTLTGRTDDSQKLQRIEERRRYCCSSLKRVQRRVANRSELAQKARQKGRDVADLPD